MALEEITWTPDFKETHTYYDFDGQETLSNKSIDEYMEAWLEDCGDSLDALIDSSESVEVCGYNRMMPEPSECAFLDELIERVNEERGDPDGKYSGFEKEKLSELRQLEEQFIGEFLKRYRPWACESVITINVPLRAWFESKNQVEQDSLRRDYSK